MLPFKEKNIVKKDWRKVDLKIALCYPNVYRAGMSGLTIQLLYALFNSREDVVCERFFLPTQNEPILSVESNQPLKNFDVVAFSFQYEEDYINALKMLMNSKVEVWVEKRKTKPLLVAGGPCIIENPNPLKNFFDLFIIGEIEPILDDFLDKLKESIQEKTVENFEGKDGYLTFKGKFAKKVWIKNLDDAPHPIAQIVPEVDENSPYMPIFGKTFLVEVVRGCPRNCRFCLISHIASPVRNRSLKKLKEIIVEGVKYTGVSKVTLIGAGIAYYPKLKELCEYVVEELKLKISVSALAVDFVDKKLFECLVKGGEKTVTLAPEAGCEKLRKTIGKPFSNRKVVEVSKMALEAGVKNLKLYFIVGLPNEKDEDLESIVRLSKQIADLGFGKDSVRLSVNPLIPKPHTPLQFYKIKPVKYFEETYKKIRKHLKNGRFRFEGLNPKHAQIQAALSIGDEKLGKIIFKVVLYGGGLGGWRKALKEEGLTFEKLLNPPKPEEKPSWNAIDVGINREILVKEYFNMLKN
ncbi:radical SAM protein [Candidatus Bathyarchaeota archaeon]|nr:MAG: radical SAM protein [Candidatus Bathyarchaeota archaeon]